MQKDPLTPHGPGFRFIDSFEVLETGKKLRATKWLSPDLPFFKDHFPGEPMMPGVLLIEAAAQAAGGIWDLRHETPQKLRYVLAQVNGFRVTRVVLPGQTIEITVTLERDFGSLGQFDAEITESGEEVARGKIVLSQKVNKA